MNRYLILTVWLWSGLCLAAQPWVNESARRVPVAYDVDVAVVGGSSAGVAAAVAAARLGAKVFLAAPRPYLGEDLCATYRLWLEPGEQPRSPLAKRMFADRSRRRGLRFKYRADQPSAGVHKDTSPPSMLADGQWDNAFRQSVQYNEDTNVVIDLGRSVPLNRIRFKLFQSPRNFEIARIRVWLSDDGQTWRDAAAVKNSYMGKGSYIESAFELSAPLKGKARYVKCLFQKAPGARRMLIGEILLFGGDRPERPAKGFVMATPMQVKRTLERALLDAKVSFLYGCYVTGVLRDAAGRPAGIVMANRAGRQAVRAKVIIDATDRAWAARLAGAEFAPYPAGPQTFKRIVVGGAPRPGLRSRLIPLRDPIGGKPPIAYGTGNWARKRNLLMQKKISQLIEYTLTIPMRDGSWASFARAEQIARDRTFDPAQEDDSETLFQVPPDPMRGRRRLAGAWPGADRAEMDWFRPAGVERMFVLGGCADIPRPAAAKLLRPLEYMAMGRRIGQAAAAQASALPAPADARLTGRPADSPAAAGDVREFLAGLRPSQPVSTRVPQPARRVPVWGSWDVVVIGGGTSGAPAAIAAARAGAKVLVVEYLHGLGGVATTGLIGIYCAGYRKGFTAETEAGVKRLAAANYVVGKMEYWRREIRRAGGDIWFGALGAGAFVEGRRVKGAVVVTPQGRGVALAKAVIDGTGNADIAAAAGAACRVTTDYALAMQGAGLPTWELGARYINTDWTFIDDCDMVDVWSAFVAARQAHAGAYDLGQLVDTRERRRIVGDYFLTPLDIVNQRTFPDAVIIANGGRLDKHGYTIHPYYMINNWRGGLTYVPYRCLLPKGLDGLLAVGLGVSAHCDAIPSIRMQPEMQNLGYAAGLAAAQAARLDGRVRAIDIKALQRQLVAKGILTPETLRFKDSFPLPDAQVRRAAFRLARKDYAGLAALLARPRLAARLLRDALQSADTPAEGKVRCAHVLGMMGDPAGAAVLARKVNSYRALDKERIDRYFPWTTWLDSYMIALGRTRSPLAREPLLAKLNLLLAPGSHYSTHYRAIGLALDALGDPTTAPALAKLVKKMESKANIVTSLDGARRVRRGKAGISELLLASVLYKLGDCDGLGERLLKAYARDLRGHYARYAAAVLKRGRTAR